MLEILLLGRLRQELKANPELYIVRPHLKNKLKMLGVKDMAQ